MFSNLGLSFYRLLPERVSECCNVAAVAFNDIDCSFILLLLPFLKARCATHQVFDLISVSPEAHWLRTGALIVPYQRGVAAGPAVSPCGNFV